MSPTQEETAGRSGWVILAPACLGYFFVLLDVTIVNVSLANMGSDLGTTREGLQWVVDGYALVLASLMLSAGDVADLFGRRRVFLAGLLTFGAASVICGLAPSVGLLVGGRALQGIGAAAICRRRWRSSTTPSPTPTSARRRSGSGRPSAPSHWSPARSRAAPW